MEEHHDAQFHQPVDQANSVSSRTAMDPTPASSPQFQEIDVREPATLQHQPAPCVCGSPASWLALQRPQEAHQIETPKQGFSGQMHVGQKCPPLQVATPDRVRSQSHLHQWPCPWDHPCGRIRRGKHRHRCTFQGKLTGCRSRRPFNCLPWGNPCTNHGWHRMSRLGRLWAAQGWHRRPRLDTLRNAVASRRAQCFEQQGN